MTKTVAFLIVLMIAVAWPSSVRGEEPAKNAATLYRQAFALLPDSATDKTDWDHVELNQKTFDSLRRCEPALQLAHQAAAIQNCDWKLDYTKGFGLLLPELGDSRHLAAACAFSARALFKQKKDLEALDRIDDMLALSQHVCQEPQVLVFWLVGFAIRDEAIQVTCEYLPTLSPPGLAKLSEMMRSAKPLPDVIPVLQHDDDNMVRFIRDTWVKTIPPAGTQFESIPQDAEGREKLIAEMKPLCDEQVRIAGLPSAKAIAEADTFRVKLKTASALFKQFVDGNPQRLSCITARGQENWAMLAAAVAVVKDGKDRLKTIKDPITGDPFAFQKLKDGFQLSSTLTLDEGRHPWIKVGPEALP
jgi:hypothetical protein